MDSVVVLLLFPTCVNDAVAILSEQTEQFLLCICDKVILKAQRKTLTHLYEKPTSYTLAMLAIKTKLGSLQFADTLAQEPKSKGTGYSQVFEVWSVNG